MVEVTSKFRGQRRLTFAHVACFVIITELQSLIDACGSTAGHCSSEKTLETQRTLCNCHFLHFMLWPSTDCSLINAKNVMLLYQPLPWLTKCVTLDYVIFIQLIISAHKHVWTALRAGGAARYSNSTYKALWVKSNQIKAFSATLMYSVILSRKMNKSKHRRSCTGSVAEVCDVTGEDRLSMCSASMNECKGTPIYERMVILDSFKWREVWNEQKSSRFVQWTGRDAASLRDLRLRTGGKSHHLGHEFRLNK